MTVYEFLKKAPEDIMALEIGRIVFGAMTSNMIRFERGADSTEKMTQLVAHVIHCLKREFKNEYYKNPMSQEIILKAKGMEKKKYKETTTLAELFKALMDLNNRDLELMKALMDLDDRDLEKKEDADGQQDHQGAGQSDGDAAG